MSYDIRLDENCTAPGPPERTVILMLEGAGVVATGDE
jgi:hypothetical protein